MKIWLVAITTLAVAHISSPLPAADKLPAFNSIRTAGPDFAVQGEYVGTVGGTHPENRSAAGGTGAKTVPLRSAIAELNAKNQS